LVLLVLLPIVLSLTLESLGSLVLALLLLGAAIVALAVRRR
jgi:hypothetical protein